MNDRVTNLISVLERYDEFATEKLAAMYKSLLYTKVRGGTIYAFGNGGSASQADHFVAELLGKFERPRAAIRAHCLSNETGTMSAVGNDWEFAEWPSRLIRTLGPRDSVLLLSTSGTSRNIERALRSAYEMGGLSPRMMLITGEQRQESPDEKREFYGATVLVIPSHDVSNVQEVTLRLLHQLVADLEVELETIGWNDR